MANVDSNRDLLELAGKIVASYVSNNPVSTSELPVVINSVYASLTGLTGKPAEDAPKPVVPARKSITDNYLVCLEDGKKLTMLKRYLRTRYKMSPEEYRSKWGLPADYPMVSPNYARRRSELAKENGLGRTRSRQKTKRTRRAA